MTRHWRWLLPVIVPTAIILVGGSLILWPAWTSWRRLLAARIDAVDERVIREARSEVDRMEDSIAESLAKPEAVTPLPIGAARVESIAAVRGLSVVSSAAQTGAAGDLRLSQDERARLRRLVVAGSYSQLVALISTLAEQPQILVVSIGLEQAAQGGKPAHWTLLVAP